MINLSLPLSATALRLGSAFLSDLAAQSEVIHAEVRGPMLEAYVSEPVVTVSLPEGVTATATTSETQEGVTLDLYIAEPDPVLTQVDLNPVQYETVVIGHERNPDYAGANAAFEQDALEAAGWTTELLLADGYLREVTEQRPLPVAPGASNPAPAPATAPGVELDADGLPWDSRIHSDATVRKAATGKWKTRKNLAPGFKEQIEAELRQVMAASPSTATTESASAPAPSPAAPPAPVAAPPAPAPAAAPAAPSPTPVPAANGAMTFAEFTRYLVANKVDQGKVMVQVQKVGLTSIPDLAKRPDLIPAVVEGLKG